MMKPDNPLLLTLDPRNLAEFLSALALAALAQRVDGGDRYARTCCWEGNSHFAIQSEHSAEYFRTLLFDRTFSFLKAMKWQRGLGGAARGILVSGNEIGTNPFISLAGDGEENTPLKGFSARVLPGPTLSQQIAALKKPSSDGDWLTQIERGVSSWGFDYRVSAHASDAGISSDAEGTSDHDPLYPAIELLGLAAAGFFVPCHAWQTTKRTLLAAVWTRHVPLSLASIAASDRIRGLPAQLYTFTWRGAAHGKGSAYHFFPPATLIKGGTIPL